MTDTHAFIHNSRVKTISTHAKIFYMFYILFLKNMCLFSPFFTIFENGNVYVDHLFMKSAFIFFYLKSTSIQFCILQMIHSLDIQYLPRYFH